MSENILVSFLKTLTSDELDSYIIDLISLDLNEEEIVQQLVRKLSESDSSD